MRFRTAFILVALAAVVCAPAAFAQEPEGWAHRMAKELMSPFCPGRSLADCPSPQAESLRMWITVQEASGRTWDDVEAEIIERYGSVVLAAPRAEGFGLAAYVIPVCLFLGGGGLVLWALRRFTGEPVAGPSLSDAAIASPVSDAELERIVDEELATGGSGPARA